MKKKHPNKVLLNTGRDASSASVMQILRFGFSFRKAHAYKFDFVFIYSKFEYVLSLIFRPLCVCARAAVAERVSSHFGRNSNQTQNIHIETE